jgi:hypothetical protein
VINHRPERAPPGSALAMPQRDGHHPLPSVDRVGNVG